jgi:hypothetical protein
MTDRADLGPAQSPSWFEHSACSSSNAALRSRSHPSIQRLRADWTQLDPVAEAGTIRCDRQRELRKLKRIALGDSLAQRTAARCIASSPRTSTTSTTASPPGHRDRGLARRARQPARQTARRRQQPRRRHDRPAGDVRRFATPARSPASAAPHPSPAARARPQDDTACTAAATANSTPRSTASPSFNNATTPKPSVPRPQDPRRQDTHEKPAAPSSATSPTSSTATSPHGPTPPPP